MKHLKKIHQRLNVRHSGLRKIIPKPAAPKRRQHIPSNSIFNFQRSSSQPPRPDPRRRPRRVGERAYTAHTHHCQTIIIRHLSTRKMTVNWGKCEKSTLFTLLAPRKNFHFLHFSSEIFVPRQKSGQFGARCPPILKGATRTARPVASFVSTIRPQTVASPSAG